MRKNEKSSDVERKGIKNKQVKKSKIFHKIFKETNKGDLRGKIDVRFAVYCIILLLFGMLMNYSASCVYAEQMYNDRTYFLVRYAAFAAVSVAITAVFVHRATLSFWYRFAKIAYIATLGLLALVLVIGTVGGGAQRWIRIGPLTVQPSEIAKMAVVLMLARYLSEHSEEISSKDRKGGSFRCGVLVPGAIIGAVCVLVALEKHISGLMIIAMLGACVMLVGGTRMKYIAAMGGAVALAGAGLILVSDYAQTRVNTWLNIDTVDPLGEAWQTLQGLYAIGSGGFFGRGLFNSLQKFGYVSQPQNDFVFTIICEELGFFGAFAVIALFALAVWRGMKIAMHVPNKFGALAVMGLTVKLGLQAALNIAVVTNSMPNTGISLPFFSSGGTSLALQIFEMGILLNISRYSRIKK